MNFTIDVTALVWAMGLLIAGVGVLLNGLAAVRREEGTRQATLHQQAIDNRDLLLREESIQQERNRLKALFESPKSEFAGSGGNGSTAQDVIAGTGTFRSKGYPPRAEASGSGQTGDQRLGHSDYEMLLDAVDYIDGLEVKDSPGWRPRGWRKPDVLALRDRRAARAQRAEVIAELALVGPVPTRSE